MRWLRRSFRPLLVVLMAAWLVSLVVRGDTGWIMRQHGRIAGSLLAAPDILTEYDQEVPLYRPTLALRSSARRATMLAAANRLSGRVDAAMVHALLEPDPAALAMPGFKDMTPEAARLHRLTDRFPREPALCAAILRACMRRELLQTLQGEPLRTWRLAHYRPPSASELDSFDRVCADGERLDPGNAAFPYIRAAGLFEAGRTGSALKALQRAGLCRRWDDYHWVELAG